MQTVAMKLSHTSSHPSRVTWGIPKYTGEQIEMISLQWGYLIAGGDLAKHPVWLVISITLVKFSVQFLPLTRVMMTHGMGQATLDTCNNT